MPNFNISSLLLRCSIPSTMMFFVFTTVSSILTLTGLDQPPSPLFDSSSEISLLCTFAVLWPIVKFYWKLHLVAQTHCNAMQCIGTPSLYPFNISTLLSIWFSQGRLQAVASPSVLEHVGCFLLVHLTQADCRGNYWTKV